MSSGRVFLSWVSCFVLTAAFFISIDSLSRLKAVMRSTVSGIPGTSEHHPSFTEACVYFVPLFVSPGRTVLIGAIAATLLLGLMAVITRWVADPIASVFIGGLVGAAISFSVGINFGGWGPPYLAPLALSGALAGLLSAISQRRARAKTGSGFCKVCWYDLRGVVEPRCPGCGEPFDLKLLRDSGGL